MAMQFLPGSLEIDNIPYDRQIWDVLTRLLRDLDGYCAYKIPVLGTASNSDVPTFIVVSRQYGVLLLDIVLDEVLSVQDDARLWSTSESTMYSRDVVLEQYSDEMESRFKRTSSLYSRKKRTSLVPITNVLLFSENSPASLTALELTEEDCFSETIATEEHDERILGSYKQTPWNGNEDQFGDILSLIEGTWDYRQLTKPINVSNSPETMNDLVLLSLNRTFKQDNAQRQVSMQIPNGPQRIRGLAGTGKTVVLSLKAALTVLRIPDFKILFLFNTQSLYNSIEKQIGDYYAKEAKASLPQGKIDILHAWGGRTSGQGLYSKLCSDYGMTPKTLRDVGGGDGLAKIYKDLQEKVGDNFKPIYDLVLIDEAQDFPNEVFEVVYQITKDPKRIVVAYDDFQSLKGLKIREFDQLFGSDKSNTPRFSPDTLSGEYAGGVAKDFVLPNCYRNPRNILMVAHGIALGVARIQGVVDSVDKVQDWNALGYQVNSPKDKELFTAGDCVEVERLDSNSTNLLEKILVDHRKTSDKLIQLALCDSRENEADYISNKIHTLVTEQGVAPHDIFVIAIETRTSENFLLSIRSKLNAMSIKSIMPGYIESNRHFYEAGSVVLTTPFRAKGNEANVIFVSNCETVTNDYSFSKRNSFFVSATRSRGWCYISGVGKYMEVLCEEIKQIQENLPRFSYTRPTDRLIARRRLILSQSDSKAEKDQRLLARIANENPDLLKEFFENTISDDKE